MAVKYTWGDPPPLPRAAELIAIGNAGFLVGWEITWNGESLQIER